MNELEFDEFLRNKINQAESTSGESTFMLTTTWTKIERGLNINRKKIILVPFAIAASISILIMAIFYFYTSDGNKEEISFRQETALLQEEFYDDANEILIEKEVFTAIEQKCKIKKALCMTQNVIELKSQWSELTIKEKEVEKEMQRLGQAPSILKAKIKIKNMKADLLKKLIKI